MIDANWWQGYGVLGYSAIVALAITWASIGIAYYNADRGHKTWIVFVISMLLFAIMFSYLVVVSVEPVWLDRTVMQPIMRTVALGAAVTGWLYTSMTLRRELTHNGSQNEQSKDNRLLSGQENGG